MVRDEIKDIILSHLKEFDPIKVGIFGSYARGGQNNHSDMDLLVEFEENTQDLYDLKLQLTDFFMSKPGIEIDICREKYIKPGIQKSILNQTVYVD